MENAVLCDEEQIFAAAQILCGNLDIDSLQQEDGKRQRGDAMLDLLLARHEDRPTKRIKETTTTTTFTEQQHHHSDKPKCLWSLERTRSVVEEFQHKWDSSTTDPSVSQRSTTVGLTKCWLGMSSTTSSTSFCSLFQNALISMAHLDIAAGWIDQTWDAKGNFITPSTTGPTTTTTTNASPAMTMIRHISLALEYWPTNPSALILAANVDRMRGTRHLPISLALYRAAMKCAHLTNILARQILKDEENNDSNNNNNKNDDVDDGNSLFTNDEKFLVETVLCQSAQEDDDGISQVLVTASYMSAMVASCVGQHDVAADSLQHFCSPDIPIARIHPHVWDAGLPWSNYNHHQSNTNPILNIDSLATRMTRMTQGAFSPHVFYDAISPELLNVLRFAFRSNGPYWKESGYNRNIYYSYWTDYPLPRPLNVSGDNNNNMNGCIVGNAVEHYIVHHVLPRVRSVVSAAKDPHAVKGFEWWVHTRPHGANLGHQLHFDTDEALLEQDGTLESPIAATVTYLTLEQDTVSYGATMLFDQTPKSKTNAEQAYLCFPKSRSLLVFPGDLLHGVLPCLSSNSNDYSSDTYNDDSSVDNQSATREFERLTFMVNFWGYRIPDRVTNLPLYGPSGPMPPPTKEHTWVHDICHGYPRTVQEEMPSDATLAHGSNSNNGLVTVSPAWDIIYKADISTPIVDGGGGTAAAAPVDEWSIAHPSTTLTIPASGTFQQRFFVTNAPDYFYSQLFEE
jgi:hypothetical protein